MSGFGGAFAIVMMGFILSAVFGGLIVFLQSYVTLASLDREVQTSSLTVKSGKIIDNHTFLVNVTLDKGHIKFSKLKYSDVFVVYTSGGKQVAVKVAWGYGPDSWHVRRVFSGGKVGDLLNPINIEAESGIWDPGETLELNVTVTQLIDLDGKWYFSITLVDGGEGSRSF